LDDIFDELDSARLVPLGPFCNASEVTAELYRDSVGPYIIRNQRYSQQLLNFAELAKNVFIDDGELQVRRNGYFVFILAIAENGCFGGDD
jgi:hypothetical protein